MFFDLKMTFELKQLTLEEKLKLLTGATPWQTYDAGGKLKKVFVSDGPHGARKVAEDGSTVKSTAMPALSTVANAWSVDAAYLEGQTIAEDCIDNGVDVLLAPGVNIKRSPLCGRNFEYFSEDPYLSGHLAAAYISGVQSRGVGTSLKHFCANNREFERLSQSSEVDERTLREIYLPAFEIALKATPWTVMCSYNLINGVYASENKWLLGDVLRGEFGFDGVVVSDWGAVHSEFRRVRAGVDLEMPNSSHAYDDLMRAYEKGYITDEQIDRSVLQILELIEKSENDLKKTVFTKEQRHENAVKIAEEGIVLLKNEDNILPFKPMSKTVDCACSGGTVYASGAVYANGAIGVNPDAFKGVLVVGHFAAEPPIGGGGSSYVETDYKQKKLSDLLNEINPELNARYCDRGLFHPYASKENFVNARTARAVVVCVGDNPQIESEGHDREGIKLNSYQEQAINELAKVNENVIVVVYAGSAIDVSNWINNVKAVVWAGFSGEGVNEAVAAILSGSVCPSGKLAETLPVCLEDTFMGSDRGNAFADWYNDGIFVGYRYYDKFGKTVAFPFGFGLSYAQFEYSDLKIEKKGELDYEISYNVTNRSIIDAKEVSQVYVKDVFAAVLRPEKELKGFSKNLIKAGETVRVSIPLNARSFAYFNLSMKKWFVENGEFEILVGSSSRDIRLKASIYIELPEDTQQSIYNIL